MIGRAVGERAAVGSVGWQGGARGDKLILQYFFIVINPIRLS